MTQVKLILTIFCFRTILTRVLKDILEKKHDKVTCQANCKQNGKIFGQTPYPCQFYSGDLEYDNLLVNEEFNYDSTDGATTSGITNPILKFFSNFALLEDEKSNLKTEVRKLGQLAHYALGQKEVAKHEQQLEEL